VERKAVIGVVSSAFGRDYTVAPRPDLPNLFEGPEVLAGRTGDLVAVFIPKKAEIRNAARLLARLGLCRLALPSHTRCVLVYSEQEAAGQLDPRHAELDFHQVAAAEARGTLRDTLHTNSGVHRLGSVTQGTRALVGRRASYLFEVSVNNGGHWEPADIPESVGVETPPSRPRMPPNLTLGSSPAWERARAFFPGFGLEARAEGDGSVLVVEEHRSARHSSIASLVQRQVAPGFWLNFTIDNGVPYPTAWTAGLIVAPAHPGYGLDPLKTFRAAAWAGWAVVRESDEEGTRALVSALTSWIREEREQPST